MVRGSIDTKPSLPKPKAKAKPDAQPGHKGKKKKFKKGKKGKKTAHVPLHPAKKKKGPAIHRPPGIKALQRGKKLKNTKYFRKRKTGDPAWRPGRPYADSYWTLGDANANFGPPGETLERSVLKVLSYKFTVVAPASVPAAYTKDVETRLALPPLSAAAQGPQQVLVLNPEYEPGVARFSLIIMRNVVEQARLDTLRATVDGLDNVSLPG